VAKRGRPRKDAGAAAPETTAYRHDATRTNIPPAQIAGEGRIPKAKRVKYAYSPHLDPVLRFDPEGRADKVAAIVEKACRGERLDAGEQEILRAVGKNWEQPWLEWAGKQEEHARGHFSVDPVALHIHERISAQAILRSAMREDVERSLFASPEQTYAEAAGQVQMIYIDPPYGVKFGSNFQPFVRKRDVKHGGDEDMTREPEMVKAYRDTWELGLHTYLTYLRDRLMVARELLHQSGSVFVQISDDNLHLVRTVLDEVFGQENFCRVLAFAKTAGLATGLVPVTQDYLVWYAKSLTSIKFRQPYLDKASGSDDFGMYKQTDPDGRRFRIDNLTSQNNNVASCLYEYEFQGKRFRPSANAQWKTTREGMDALQAAGRLIATGRGLYYKRYLDDFPVRPLTDSWPDTGSGGFTEEKLYVVQTNFKVVARCMLMTSDPGDLVLDPTCGSGTTAYVAEHWGRRWITIDTSRVPLALARQRILTATFPYYELKSPRVGPAGGFVYQRKQNRKGEETGGLVPHITLKSIAKNETPAMEVLVDRPEEVTGVTRVAGPFVVEATIAPVQPIEAAGESETTATS